MDILNKKELSDILINIIIVKLVISYPRKIMAVAGNSAWIVGIYVTLVMLAFYYVIVKVYDFSHPLLQKAEKSGGKLFKYIAGISVLTVLILSMTSIVRLYPESVKIILLPRTPIEVIILFLSIAAVLGVFCGIQALAKTISIFLPIAGVIMVACIILLYQHMDINNLMPLWGPGIKAIFTDGLTFLSAFSDILILFILNINANDIKKAASCGYKAILISGGIMTVILLAYCLVFPYNISQYFLMPYYQLTRIAQIGELFTRVEALFEFIWTILAMLYFSVYLYVVCIIWKELFNLKYYKPLAAPFMILTAFLALKPDIFLEFDKGFSIYTTAVIYITFLTPFIVGVVEKIRRKNK